MLAGVAHRNFCTASVCIKTNLLQMSLEKPHFCGFRVNFGYPRHIADSQRVYVSCKIEFVNLDVALGLVGELYDGICPKTGVVMTHWWGIVRDYRRGRSLVSQLAELCGCLCIHRVPSDSVTGRIFVPGGWLAKQGI
jgi:hypothetical protein